MKMNDITIRIPYSIKAYDRISEAVEDVECGCTVSKVGDVIHVDARVSAYDAEDAYRYLWKRLALALATLKSPDDDVDWEAIDAMSNHVGQMRRIVERIAYLYPQVERMMQGYGIGQETIDASPDARALQDLCATAQEFLRELCHKAGSRVAPPPELVETLNLSEGGAE